MAIVVLLAACAANVNRDDDDDDLRVRAPISDWPFPEGGIAVNPVGDASIGNPGTGVDAGALFDSGLPGSPTQLRPRTRTRAARRTPTRAS